MRDERVVLDLSRAEALILFEWLARLDGAGLLPFEHEAEQQVVWSLEGRLEKVLPEVVEANYRLRVERARESVLNADGPPC